jgi:exodeoxyribonuclease VII large subunit
LLEGNFPRVWVSGEISNLRRIASGHWYFSLKDAAAQVRCAMFRGNNRLLRFSPDDGMQVLARARVSLYEVRGDFQLIVEHLEEAGDGALLRAFEALKRRLAAEGLFDPERKRPLPTLPRRIGVITSPGGAAVRDVLSVLRRRFPAIPVRIYPVPVQGPEAAPRIAVALRLAAARQDCDVLLLTRGGGSLEDLWAFNEESLARAIAACEIPVVSAVGHQTDFTIADLVADHRAPTPSAAAELLSPDQRSILDRFAQLEQRLVLHLRRRLTHQSQRLTWLSGRLRQQHPGRRLETGAQRLDELDQRLARAMRNAVARRRMRLEALLAHLRRHSPSHRLTQVRMRLQQLMARQRHALERRLEDRRLRLAKASGALQAISPLATLERGYAIVTRLPKGTLVRRAGDVARGDRVRARLGRGVIECRVEKTDGEAPTAAPQS